MTDNVVDFTDRWIKKEEHKEKIQKIEEINEINEINELHDICTLVANDALNALYEEYDLEIDKIEFSPVMIFFFEAFKGLIMKCAGHWHPFQDAAQDFFDSQGIEVHETEDGGYHFALGNKEEILPANDVDNIPEP